MLALTFMLSTKHLGIIITCVFSLILIIWLRNALIDMMKDIRDDIRNMTVDFIEMICENVIEYKRVMGFIFLLGCVAFGIALICGCQLALSGIVAGAIVAGLLFFTAVLPD